MPGTNCSSGRGRSFRGSINCRGSSGRSVCGRGSKRKSRSGRSDRRWGGRGRLESQRTSCGEMMLPRVSAHACRFDGEAGGGLTTSLPQVEDQFSGSCVVHPRSIQRHCVGWVAPVRLAGPKREGTPRVVHPTIGVPSRPHPRFMRGHPIDGHTAVTIVAACQDPAAITHDSCHLAECHPECRIVLEARQCYDGIKVAVRVQKVAACELWACVSRLVDDNHVDPRAGPRSISLQCLPHAPCVAAQRHSTRSGALALRSAAPTVRTTCAMARARDAACRTTSSLLSIRSNCIQHASVPVEWQ